MHNTEVKQYLINCWDEVKEIDNAISSSRGFDKKTAYLTKYCVIRCCGIFEVSYKTILARYAGHKLCNRTENYIEDSVLGNSMNPSLDRILYLTKRFDPAWSKLLADEIENHERVSIIKSAIKSLVKLRNSFAHGQNTTTTIHNIKNYFTEACRVLFMLDRIVGVNHDDPEHILVCQEFRSTLNRRLIEILKRNMRYRRIKESGFRIVVLPSSI